MKFKLVQFIKTLAFIFSLLGFVVISVILFEIRESKNLNELFEETKLNISRKELIENWGNPDEEFDLNLNDDKRHILKYNCMIFNESYIFIIRAGENNISEKYVDD